MERWTAEWGGVYILLPRKKQFEVIKTMKDTEGRIVIVELNFMQTEVKLTIANIYAPNIDKPEFFLQLTQLLESFSENKILIGDFNLVLDTKVDRLNSNYNNNKSKEVLETLMEEMLLEDIWRVRNLDTRRYSWFSKGVKSASRIDFALVDKGLSDKVMNCSYTTGIRTDHSAYYMAVDLFSVPHGRGYWKLNVSHLHYKSFLDKLNKTVDDSLLRNRRKSHMEVWECLKFELANTSQEYARNHASEMKLIIEQLQGNTHNDYLRYGKRIIHEGYHKYNTSKAIHYA